MNKHYNSTVAAISTAMTNSGIGIVRMTGSEAIEIADKVYDGKNHKRLSDQKTHTIHYGYILDDGETVDEVLVMLMRGPHSYTGEDTVEINCHGGLYVTSKVLTLVLSYGARMALHGEFSKRAFLNGKIDLTQAEAINDLICADNKDSAKLAVNSLSGSISKMINPLINDLEQCIAHIEVNIDYPEYDDNGIINANEVSLLVEDWKKQCDKIINMAQNSLIIKEGIKTVIVGKPNVGKSSLLNALLQQDKAKALHPQQMQGKRKAPPRGRGLI